MAIQLCVSEYSIAQLKSLNLMTKSINVSPKYENRLEY